MAACTTSQWGDSYSPQVRLTVTQSSSTNTTATLSWKLEYVAHGYGVQTAYTQPYTAVIDGTTVASGKFATNGVTTTRTIASGTKVINKTTSSRTISFSCSMTFNITWSGSYASTKSASGSISVAAKTSYKVTYNANGGSGAPPAQTKWAGTNLTLSSTKPTRTGYSFQGWSLTQGGSVYYPAGGTCGRDENLTLYAVWKADTYTVSFNANKGTGAPASQTKTYGQTLTLSSTKPTRTNYNFLGWGTSASSITVAYSAGGSYTKNVAVTLYAIWQLAYTAPRIKIINFFRCDADGTDSDTGTYLRVYFGWESDKIASSILIEWKESTATEYTNSYSAEIDIPNKGLVTDIIGDGGFDVETSYDVRITVTDEMGSTKRYLNVAPMEFIVDFLAGGRGIAFGKPATTEGIIDSSWPPNFAPSLVGSTPIAEGTDLNSLKDPGNYGCYDAVAETLVNCPSERGFHMEVGYAYNDSAYIYQQITGGLSAVTWYRRCFLTTEAWSEWRIRSTMALISNSTDLNTVTTPGIYFSNGDGNVNAPPAVYTSSFALEVIPAGSAGQLIQRATRCHKDVQTISERIFYGGSWGSWQLLSKTSNRVLWSGGIYMSDSQTATLNEPISEQLNGIVIVFSEYKDGAAAQSNFNSFFVPKKLVSSHGGNGSVFDLSCPWCHAIKYLYISDTKITGHTYNNLASHTINGVTYENNRMVMRYVISV